MDGNNNILLIQVLQLAYNCLSFDFMGKFGPNLYLLGGNLVNVFMTILQCSKGGCYLWV